MGGHSTVQAAGSAELMPCDPPRAGHLPSLSQALGFFRGAKGQHAHQMHIWVARFNQNKQKL